MLHGIDIFMSKSGNQNKVGHLWRLQGAKERLHLVKANLTDEGSFDDAIMGCDGVFHTASPVLGKPTYDLTVSKILCSFHFI